MSARLPSRKDLATLDPQARRHAVSTAFVAACSAGLLRDVKVLMVEYGADVECMAPAPPDPSAVGPQPSVDVSGLMAAASRSRLAVAKHLCAQHASVDTEDAAGATALHYAAAAGDVEIVELLCQRGANVFAANHAGRTPLHEALAHEHTYAAQALLGFYPEDAVTEDVIDRGIGSASKALVGQLLTHARECRALQQRVESGLLPANDQLLSAGLMSAVLRMTLGLTPSRWSVPALDKLFAATGSRLQVCCPASLYPLRRGVIRGLCAFALLLLVCVYVCVALLAEAFLVIVTTPLSVCLSVCLSACLPACLLTGLLDVTCRTCGQSCCTRLLLVARPMRLLYWTRSTYR
jgi:hypothetical protein